MSKRSTLRKRSIHNKKFYFIVSLAALIFLVHFVILFLFVKEEIGPKKRAYQDEINATFLWLLQEANRETNNVQLSNHLNILSNSELKMNDQIVKISVTDQPTSDQQFYGSKAVERIKNYLYHTSGGTDFSWQLKTGQWLNYNISIPHNFFIIALLLILSELIVIALILLYVWAIWRFTVPVKKFKQSAERLGIDVHTAPLEASGPPIIREAANAINKMQQRIQELIDNRTKMLAAISHDLRTPITRLKLRAQFLDDEAQVEKISQDLDEMEAMIASVLDFSKSDAPHEKKVKFDINALIQTICYDFVDLGHCVRYETMEQKRVPIFGRSMALKRTITNLINNAIKYGSDVIVRLSTSLDQVVEINIEDNGPGIPEPDLKKVFEPYYRSTNEYNKTVAGTGLGLTIAHEVVKAHEGTIQLSNREEGGLRVSIMLPAGY